MLQSITAPTKHSFRCDVGLDADAPMDVGKRKTWEHTNRAERQNFVRVWFLVRQKRTGAPIDYMAIN
jgi:hypothetical protein